MALRRASFGGRTRKMHSSTDLNLTPMIDTFVVMLIFLVKSYSSSPSYLTPTQNIELSATESKQGAPDEPAVILGKDGLLLNGEIIIGFKEKSHMKKFEKREYLPELQKRLESIKEADEDFSGILILQADKKTSYQALKPVLRTAGMAGYHDIKFAGNYIE